MTTATVQEQQSIMIWPAIAKLEIRSVGVLQNIDVEFSPGLNIISGDNGTGKTTLLNCIRAVATNTPPRVTGSSLDEKSSVTAHFHHQPLTWSAEQDRGVDEENAIRPEDHSIPMGQRVLQSIRNQIACLTSNSLLLLDSGSLSCLDGEILKTALHELCGAPGQRIVAMTQLCPDVAENLPLRHIRLVEGDEGIESVRVMG